MNRRRLKAMVVKEGWQVLRDPSALLITFIFPPLLMIFFSYGVSLDVRDVKLGLVAESDGPYTRELAAAFAASPYLQVFPARSRQVFERSMVTGEVQVVAVIPQDFDAMMNNPHRPAQIQVLADGSEPNSANLAAAYVRGAFANWLAQHSAEHSTEHSRGKQGGQLQPSAMQLQPRYWFNPELEGKRIMVPGAIAIVMTIIGTLLTAMVIAREWERGTMEAMMSTPATNGEIILSKLFPYFILAMVAICGCTFMATMFFDVPLRGSIGTLLMMGAVFLFPALGQGLLISTLAPNQFVAAQIGVLSGFLPAVLLSGFIFEIRGMPEVVQWITAIVPARYFVASLQTIFLAGDLWEDLIPNLLALLALGTMLFSITFLISKRTLD
jgi:drug efflux transport system permease protein